MQPRSGESTEVAAGGRVRDPSRTATGRDRAGPTCDSVTLGYGAAMTSLTLSSAAHARSVRPFVKLAAIVALAVFGALVLGAAPAAAAVSAAAVTTPSPDAPFLTAIDASAGATPVPLTVSGTATVSDAADTIDLVCFSWESGSDTPTTAVVLAGVDTDDATGAWSVSIPDLSALPADAPCTLLAVPAGTIPATLTGFTGPTLFVSRRAVQKFVTGANAGKASGYSVRVVAPGAVARYGPLGDCGVCATWQPTGERYARSQRLFDGTATLGSPGGLTPAPAGDLLVDGVPALDPSRAAALPGAEGLAGFEPLDVQITPPTATNPATTIVEQFDLVRCMPEVASCTSLAKVGIHWKRTIEHLPPVAARAATTTITDELTATDGKPHSVDVWFQEQVGQTAPGAGLLLPWVAGAAFQTYPANTDLPAPSSSPSSVLVKRKRDGSDTDASFLTGSHARSFLPSALRSGTSADGERYHSRLSRTVPASASITVRQGLAWDQRRSAVEQEAVGFEDRFAGPVMTISAPKPGASVLTRPVVVRGTATDRGTVASVKVNGLTLTPNSAGAWSGRLSLVDGNRRITVIATDAHGNQTRSAFRVLVTALRITGTNRKEKINGTDRANTILALGGNDRVLARGGNDKVNGGPGNDWIDLGAGSDRGRGLDGNDTIDCGNGARRDKDRLEGGRGNDKLRCPDGRGNDVLLGGPGRDFCVGDRGDRFVSCEVRKIA